MSCDCDLRLQLVTITKNVAIVSITTNIYNMSPHAIQSNNQVRNLDSTTITMILINILSDCKLTVAMVVSRFNLITFSITIF
jgi:hypothetical protein